MLRDGAWHDVYHGALEHHAVAYRYFDPVTLEPCDPPRPITDSRHEPTYVHAVTGSADGRFAAVAGFLRLGTPGRTHDLVLAVHDFHHPLERVLRPAALLGAGDLEAISAAAGDTEQRTDAERHVLGLLEAVLAHRLDGAAGADRPR
ncbi:MAG: hypothetical protein K0R62_4012 [Nonomuraea muscovyensis]|nr:hypothetical protein [Nonomuraea muscovyensis]